MRCSDSRLPRGPENPHPSPFLTLHPCLLPNTHTRGSIWRWTEKEVPDFPVLSSLCSQTQGCPNTESCSPLAATPRSFYPWSVCLWSCTHSGDTEHLWLMNIWYWIKRFVILIHKENNLVQRKPFERELIITYLDFFFPFIVMLWLLYRQYLTSCLFLLIPFLVSKKIKPCLLHCKLQYLFSFK